MCAPALHGTLLEEALRMGTVQEVAPNKDAALEKAIEIAKKIAACGPLGIKTSLASSHMAVDESPTAALGKLDEQYRALLMTRDFQEGRDAEAQSVLQSTSGAELDLTRIVHEARDFSSRSRAAETPADCRL
jgi:hypothetical protein